MAKLEPIRSILLEQLARILVPLLLVFSLFLLLRGHDLPGGGFIGGLVASAAFLILGLCSGSQAVEEALKTHPSKLMGWGLVVAVLSALPGLFVYGTIMKGVWVEVPLPAGSFKIGTPVVFDMGVFLIVVGMVTTIYLSIREED